MTTSSRFLGFGALLLVLSPALHAADWPCRLGPQHNGHSAETGWNQLWPATGPNILWKASVGTGYSSIAVADGRAYTMGHSGGAEAVFCFEAETGKRLWTHRYPCQLLDRYYDGGSSATPAVHEGRVYTMGKEGQIFCLDAASGQVIWQADAKKLAGVGLPEWGFASSAVIEGDAVLFQAGPVLALNRTRGSLLWKSKDYKPSYSTPAVFDSPQGRLLASLSSDGLAVMRTAGGEELAFTRWKTSFNTNATTPMFTGQGLFVSTGYGKGCGLFRLENNALTAVYENRSMSNHMNNCVLIGGHLYGFDGNAHNNAGPVALVCLELKSGKEKWREEGLGCGALIAAGGTLIVQAEDGRILLVKPVPDRFEKIAAASVLKGRSWTAPALANGRLYCRNAAGDLVCVDLKTP